MKMDKLNYYEVLGVAPTADKKEIRKAYRRMAELHHPDKLKTSDEKLIKLATEEMIIINEAKEVLLDEVKRRKYDLEIQQKATFPSYRQDEENALIRMIVQTQNVLSKIGEAGVDITEADRYFFQAKYAFQNRYYRNGLELLQYAVRSAKDAHYQHTVREILKARKTILAVENDGFNVDFAKNILIQAKPAIEDGNYDQANEFANAAIRAAEKIKEREARVREEEREARVRAVEEGTCVSRAGISEESAPTAHVSWSEGGSEDEGCWSERMSPRKFVERMNESEFNELKKIMAEREEEFRRRKRLQRDMINLEMASRYKDIMKRFYEYQQMEEDTITEIMDKFKGGAKVEVDFELDLDNIEFIEDEDIPEEDKEVLEADWNEEKMVKNINIYRSVLEEAWADGIVTEDEEAMLERLRNSLGLEMDEHRRMEEDIIKKHLLNDYL